MTRRHLRARREYFSLVHGVTRRAIGVFSDQELDFRPQPGLRSPRELIYHIYSQERLLAEAARDGRMTAETASLGNPEGPEGATICQTLTTVATAQAFADVCHAALGSIFGEMSDDDLARPVESPYGTFPAWQYFTFAYDEHWHHRGQLYTYLRLLGKEPPMLYDYEAGA
ncbi:MAG: DinB family protein [Acidobacteriota bacterium]